MSPAQVASIGRALSSTLRVEVLWWALRRGRTFTPKIAARGVGRQLELVAYHVRVLAAAGLLEQTDVVPVGGTCEHYYQVTEDAQRLERMLTELALVGG